MYSENYFTHPNPWSKNTAQKLAQPRYLNAADHHTAQSWSYWTKELNDGYNYVSLQLLSERSRSSKKKIPNKVELILISIQAWNYYQTALKYEYSRLLLRNIVLNFCSVNLKHVKIGPYLWRTEYMQTFVPNFTPNLTCI